jgi:indole-3-glycerol phosphate synthase
MSDFLAVIAGRRRERIAREERLRSTREWREEAEARRGDARPFSPALRRPEGEGLRVIAETKKGSPSAGVLVPAYDPAAIAARYEAAGAAAISVLTEPSQFQGSMEHLEAVRRRVSLPILCKDFIVHERQIYEARVRGADAALLIVALLSPGQLRDYAALAREVGLDALVEVFDEREVDRALELDFAIGANNRDLRTLEVDPGRAVRLLSRIPVERVRIAESGYRTRGELDALVRAGIDGVLIGEALLRAESVEETFAELFGAPGEGGARP